MGEVINLFTREQVDALEDDPDAIFVFIEEHLDNFLVEANVIAGATTQVEIQAAMRKVKRIVDEWPDL